MKRLRALALNLLVSLVVLVLVVGAIEGAFRLFPRLMPRGVYGASHYRPDLLSPVYDDTVVYNKVRFMVRKPNSEGFLDVEHALERPPGVARIGVFGDSYVESMQVEPEQMFYRLAQQRIGAERVELLGFGMSGWGTLHSFLAFEHMAPRYGLDAVVYLFVENDLGDNALEVQGMGSWRLSPKAFATLSPLPPGYELVLRNPPDQQSAGIRISKWFQEHFLLARLIWHRIGILARMGVAIRPDEAQQQMATRARGVPRQDDLPSTWPTPYVERATALGERILRHWRDRAHAVGCDLIVLYVPRGTEHLTNEAVDADSWRSWLVQTTQELGLPLIDPRDALRRRLEAGDAVYDDHWTPAGHEVIAEVLAPRLDQWLVERARRLRSQRVTE